VPSGSERSSRVACDQPARLRLSEP
jgi:hypothetical protein